MSSKDAVSNANTDFLKLYEDASPAARWPLVLSWVKFSSLPFFKQLRDKSPVLVAPECTLLATYEDVIEVMKQPRLFTVELYKPKMGDYLMTEDETPMHNTEKAIMLSFLKPEELPRVRKFVAEYAQKTLDDARGHIDLAVDYSRMVPTALVQNYFGLDGISPRTLIKWSYWNQYDAFHNQPFHHLPNMDEVHANMQRNNRYLGYYIAWLLVRKWFRIKFGFAQDNIATRVIAAKYPKDAKFGLARQGINIGGLLIGAVETTSQAVIHALDELMSRPDVLKSAIEAAKSPDTAAFDRYVWEALRFNITFRYCFRTAAQDYVLAKGTPRETAIAKGTTVLALWQSAMFDAQRFPDPEVFNPTRDFGDSFHFGYGSHECMGKHIGKVMIPEMVRQVLLRKGIRADAPVDYRGGPVPEGYHLSWQA